MSVQKQIEELQEQNNLMKKLASFEGFYHVFLENLKTTKTRHECFEKVNDLHFDLFGFTKYSCYKSFTNSVIKQRNKK